MLDRRHHVLLPLLALLQGCQVQAPAPPPPPEGLSGTAGVKLDHLTRRFLELAWALHPTLAAEAGVRPPALRPLLSTGPEILAARGETRNLLAEALRLRREGLPPSRQSELAFLVGFLKAAAIEFEELEPWARDPGSWLDEIQGGLALARLAPTPTGRAEQALLWLQDLDRVLLASREHLRFCPPAFTAAASRRARILAERLREGHALPPDGGPDLAQELAAGAGAAARALEAWAEFLTGEVLHRQPGSYILGEELIRAILSCREGLVASPAELAAEIAQEEARLREGLIGAEGSGSPAAAVSPSGREAMPTFLAGVEGPVRLREACLQGRLLPAEWDRPGRADEALAMGLARLGAGRWAEEPPSPEDSSPAERRLLQARATWPGLQALQSCMERAGTRLGRSLPAPLLWHGWLSYAEDLLCQADQDPEIHRVRSRRRHQECLEGLLALQLHLGQATLDQAARILEERAALAPAAAQDRAVELARNPFRWLGWLGCREIHRLRREGEAAEGGTFQPSRFHRELLAAGAPPLWWVRRQP